MDRVSHVRVEEVDRALGKLPPRGVCAAREGKEPAERQPILEEPKRHPNDLDVAGPVADLAFDPASERKSLPFDRLDERGRDPASARELLERQVLLVAVAALRGGDGEREV